MSKLLIVVGGQFGSEGKGAAAGQLAARFSHPLVIRTGGPNAGHTVIGMDGKTHKLRMLPTAAVTNKTATLALSAGSVVDVELLKQECTATDSFVFVDRSATILTDAHRKSEVEDPDMQWGSTREGVGAARADRIHRTAEVWGNRSTLSMMTNRVSGMVRQHLRSDAGVVLIEAAQGYGLGLHTDFYPKTTSADCRAIDALADVGISPWGVNAELEVWIVVRPFPIRVAGDSGPLYAETTWDGLGLAPEYTTVTGKLRRVGLWDSVLLVDAIRANGGGPDTPYPNRVKIWFSMMDQVIPSLTAKTAHDQLTNYELSQLRHYIDLVNDCGARVGAIGTGPDTSIVTGAWL